MAARRSGRGREFKVTQNLVFLILGMALVGIPAIWFGIAILIAGIRA